MNVDINLQNNDNKASLMLDNSLSDNNNHQDIIDLLNT